MSQEFYLFLAKSTFTEIEFDTVIRETFKEEIESLSESAKIVSPYDNIIEIIFYPALFNKRG